MPTDTNEHARRVLYHPDGEAIDRTDDNNAQLFQRMHEFNLLLSGAQVDGWGEPTDPGASAINTPERGDGLNGLGFTYGEAVMTPFPGAAFIYSPTTRALTISAGPLVGLTDEPWQPTGEEFAVYRSAGNMSVQTAVGDATNPRIDLLEVKFSYADGDPQTRHFEDAVTRAPSSQPSTNKDRHVVFDYQIKAGTPAANPTYPTPTAGYVALAAVYVPANHNAVHSPDNIRDLRVPFGIRAVDVDVKGFHFTGSNPWTALGMLAAAGGSSDPDDDRVIVPCPISSRNARLVAVGIHGDLGGDARFALVRMDHDNTSPLPPPTITELCDLGGICSAPGFAFADAIMIADALNVGGVYKGVRAANTRVGTPLWCNGWSNGAGRPGVASDDGVETTTSRLAVSFGGETAASCRVAYVRFWIAEGL